MRTVRDEAIVQLIRSRLDADRRTGGQTIDVTIVDDEIVLVGECDSEEQRQIAVQIVSGMYGVRTVVNRIRVRRIVVVI